MSARWSREQEELQIHMGFQPPPFPKVTLTRNPTTGRKHAWSPPAYHTVLSQPPDLVALIRAAAAFLPFGKRKNPDSMFLYSGNLVREYPLASKKWQAELI